MAIAQSALVRGEIKRLHVLQRRFLRNKRSKMRVVGMSFWADLGRSTLRCHPSLRKSTVVDRSR